MEEISKILVYVPMLLEFFIPGFLTIFVYRQLKASVEEKLTDKIHIGASVVISFLIRAVLFSLYHLPFVYPWLSKIAPTVYVRFIIESLVGILLAIVVLRLRDNTKIRDLYSCINNTTLSDDVFKCCDLDKRKQATVVTDTGTFTGRLLMYDLSDACSWIVLDQVTETSATKTVVGHWSDRLYERYMVPMGEVKSIVVHYDADDVKTPEGYQDAAKVDRKARKAPAP